MNEPLISVVVPIYNVEKYLERCLHSIVNQTYGNLEIILVDDGSTDTCPVICDAWGSKDNRIKVIHKHNAGAGMARNTGIEQASGEYVCFVDSDDYLEHTALEECFLRLADSPVDAVLFGSSNVNENGTIKQMKLIPDSFFFQRDQLTQELLPSLFVYGMGFGVSVWGKLFKLSVIRENGIFFKSEREIYSEDAFFNLEFFSKASSAAVVSKHLYYYYENDNSLSRSYKKERQEKIDDFLVQALKLVEKENLPSVVGRYIQARYHSYAIASMKQIVLSEIPANEKLTYLKAEYSNKILRKTLRNEIFRIEKRSLALFFWLIKMRCYPICNLLLWIRVNK